MKNKLTSLLLIILIIIPTIMGLVVISSFIFIGFNHYQDFINISNLGEYGRLNGRKIIEKRQWNLIPN